MSRRRSTHPYLDAPLPLAMAHRGGALLAENVGIENTTAAFSHAVDLGYRYLETDVHVSADGVVYAFHDEHLGRMTGVDAPIAALTSREVDRALVDGREPVPRMEHLLEAFPAACFNIDVKSDEAVGPTVRLLHRARAAERVCLASFSDRRLARLRRACPEAAASAGPVDVATMRLAPLELLRRTVTARGVDCLQVPVRRGPVTVVTPQLVERCHDLDLQVHVWTVDDPGQMRYLLDVGVDGLVTDRPDLLRDVLIERGAWSR